MDHDADNRDKEKAVKPWRPDTGTGNRRLRRFATQAANTEGPF
jgi:hypothetical protein